MPNDHPPARISPLSPPYTPEVESELDRFSPSWRTRPPLAIHRVWARHSRLGLALAAVGRFLLQDGELDPKDRELVILRTCALSGAEYEWGVHACGYSLRSGLSERTIEATAVAPTDDRVWSTREHLLMRLVDEFEASVDITDELWTQLANVWTATELLELLLVAGFYRFVAFSVKATRTAPEEWAPRFPSRRVARPPQSR